MEQLQTEFHTQTGRNGDARKSGGGASTNGSQPKRSQIIFNTSAARESVPATLSKPKELDVASEAAPDHILRCLCAATLFHTTAKHVAQKKEHTQENINNNACPRRSLSTVFFDAFPQEP